MYITYLRTSELIRFWWAWSVLATQKNLINIMTRILKTAAEATYFLSNVVHSNESSLQCPISALYKVNRAL